MLLGYISSISDPNEMPELCIVADRPSHYSTPVRVRSLRQTDASVHFISNEEAVTVTTGQEEGLIIASVRPSELYLTPNMPERPGFKVDRVKILQLPNNDLCAFFDRGKGWEEWTPIIRLY